MAIIRHSFLYSAFEIRSALSHSFAICVMALQLITLEMYSVMTHLRSDSSCSNPSSSNVEICFRRYRKQLRTRRRYDDRLVLSVCDELASKRCGTSRCKTVACFLLAFVKQACGRNNIRLLPEYHCQSGRFGSSMISAYSREQTALWK